MAGGVSLAESGNMRGNVGECCEAVFINEVLETTWLSLSFLLLDLEWEDFEDDISGGLVSYSQRSMRGISSLAPKPPPWPSFTLPEGCIKMKLVMIIVVIIWRVWSDETCLHVDCLICINEKRWHQVQSAIPSWIFSDLFAGFFFSDRISYCMISICID